MVVFAGRMLSLLDTSRLKLSRQFQLVCMMTRSDSFAEPLQIRMVLGMRGLKLLKVLSDMPLGTEMLRKKMTIKGEIDNGWYR